MCKSCGINVMHLNAPYLNTPTFFLTSPYNFNFWSKKISTVSIYLYTVFYYIAETAKAFIFEFNSLVSHGRNTWNKYTLTENVAKERNNYEIISLCMKFLHSWTRFIQTSLDLFSIELLSTASGIQPFLLCNILISRSCWSTHLGKKKKHLLVRKVGPDFNFLNVKYFIVILTLWQLLSFINFHTCFGTIVSLLNNIKINPFLNNEYLIIL